MINQTRTKFDCCRDRRILRHTSQTTRDLETIHSKEILFCALILISNQKEALNMNTDRNIKVL